MLKFKPDPIHILTAIGITVAIAGGSLYVILLGLWMSDRLRFSGQLAPILWLLIFSSTALVALGLWWHSGKVENATTTLRLTYALGLSGIFGWWLGVLLFVLV